MNQPGPRFGEIFFEVCENLPRQGARQPHLRRQSPWVSAAKGPRRLSGHRLGICQKDGWSEKVGTRKSGPAEGLEEGRSVLGGQSRPV